MAGKGITERRRAHVEALCTEHGIEWTRTPGVSRASAVPRDRTIRAAPVTMVRSYYVVLHEIAHCVLGYDYDAPAAPQEAAAWEWAIAVAIEDPSPGLMRHMFRVLWHYLLRDMQFPKPGHRSFPEPDSPFWFMLGTLDDGPRLTYEAAKLTNLSVLVNDAGDWTTRITSDESAQSAQAALDAYRARVAAEQATADAKHAAKVARWGGPSPAGKGTPARIGDGKVVHAFAAFGRFGVELTRDDDSWPQLLCGQTGFVHPAASGESVTCRDCLRGSAIPVPAPLLPDISGL